MNAAALRAYGASRAAMDLRTQEADVFRRVIGAMRATVSAPEDDIRRARAIADNRRLWLAVEGAVAHPSNALPPGVRASLLSLGRAVRREMDTDAPDIAFLIDVNEQVAAGLTSKE